MQVCGFSGMTVQLYAHLFYDAKLLIPILNKRVKSKQKHQITQKKRGIFNDRENSTKKYYEYVIPFSYI